MKPTPSVQVGDLTIRYLVDGSTSGKPGLFELTVPAGARVPPPHTHRENDEYIYVLEGVLRYVVGDESRDLGVGDHMVSPRGMPHAFSNPFEWTARALVTQFPDFGPQYFEDIAQLVSRPGPPDVAQIAQVMARYGLTPMVPRA